MRCQVLVVFHTLGWVSCQSNQNGVDYWVFLTGMPRLASVSSTPTKSSPPGMSSRDKSTFNKTFATQQGQRNQVGSATEEACSAGQIYNHAYVGVLHLDGPSKTGPRVTDLTRTTSCSVTTCGQARTAIILVISTRRGDMHHSAWYSVGCDIALIRTRAASVPILKRFAAREA